MIEKELALMEAYQEDPELFFKEVLNTVSVTEEQKRIVGETLLSPKQKELLAALPVAMRERRPIVVPSGHSQGKDFICGGISLWALYCHVPCKVILTAPTDRQLDEIMWNEVQTRWGNTTMELGGTIYKSPKIFINPEHFLLGFVTNKTKEQVGKAQGFHSPTLIVIASEAQAIPDSTFEELDSILSGERVLLIMIGNPLRTSGKFARAIKDPVHNIVINMDCEDSPNVIHGKEIVPGMASKAWVDEKRREWYDKDPNHPSWLSRVKGQLPRSSIDNVFSYDILDQAIGRTVNWRDRKCTLGLDVAAFGDDESAFYAQESGSPLEMFTTAKKEPTDTSGRAAVMANRHKAGMIVVDAQGLGDGNASMLRELRASGTGWDVYAFYSSTPHKVGVSAYANDRAAAWFYARDLMVDGKIAMPDDPVLYEELAEVQYGYNSKGQILLEKKEDTKDRLGRSPNRADAFIYAVWGLKYVKADRRKSDPYADADSTVLHNPRSKSYMVA